VRDDLKDAALEYHRAAPAGKLAIHATKPLANQRDLALAYSPGVAAACEEIVRDPAQAASLTGRGNLVAVITNGSAVLGLGNIGPLAGKPVMEGKAVLFKKFSGIDVFDLEIAEHDPDRLVDIIASLEPTFGGINLEDIKAPECFIVERKLRERLRIPVFHDDQHGTAIIVGAAILNGLRLVGKDIGAARLVTSGAGAAALSCLDLLVRLGLRRENIVVTDIAGVVYRGRTREMDPFKERYAVDTTARRLDEVLEGADVFLGLSAPRVVRPEWLARMAARPLVFALANPVPEILPEEVRATRPDAIIATGRSDYPNQVNNVLCFPYIFRGALDAGATTINDEMKLAAVRAIADLAMAEPSEIVAKAYGGGSWHFGPEYLIPKPFDPRLIVRIAPAVAQAAVDSGVATRPLGDLKAYRQRLVQFVFQTGFLMKPLMDQAKAAPQRVAFAEGEERAVLQAAQELVDEGIALPVLVGDRQAIRAGIAELGLRIEPGRDVMLIEPSPADHGPGRNSARAMQALRSGEAGAVICGTTGSFNTHLRNLDRLVGKRPGITDFSTVTALVLPSGIFFICDTHVTPDPPVPAIVEMTLLAAEIVRQFGIRPCIALLSHSNYGSRDDAAARKMRDAAALLRERAPDLVADGEMTVEAALSEEIRAQLASPSRLKGPANVLIMPNVDAANISASLLKMLGGGVSVGPIMIGAAAPVHILTRAVTVRGLVNMTALAVVQAQAAGTKSI
jgi:malate dehydrogenase (oxaloacetate-decarboxylating)(NADP+)